MKKLLLILLLCSFMGYGYTQNKVIPNPASLYAKILGYKSEVRIDSIGNQNKVCVFPDGTECDEWLFFRGVCGQEFSYCALKGCQIETEYTETSQYAVCLCIDSIGNKVKIPLDVFMNQNGDFLIKNSEMNKKK